MLEVTATLKTLSKKHPSMW